MFGTFTAITVYVAINILINVGLAIQVIRMRRRTQTSLGGGGDTDLEWSIRAHGNNAEYAAFALASFVLLALLDTPWVIANLICFTYTLGRCFMAYSLGWRNGRGQLRQIGMIMTLFSLISSAVALLVLATDLDM